MAFTGPVGLGISAWCLPRGNGTIIGASANVVAAGLAEESGNDISFNRFFKTGFPIMILTLLTSTVYVVVRYAINWENSFNPLGNLAPVFIIGTMMIASLSLTPYVYGKFSGSVDDTEVE